MEVGGRRPDVRGQRSEVRGRRPETWLAYVDIAHA